MKSRKLLLVVTGLVLGLVAGWAGLKGVAAAGQAVISVTPSAANLPPDASLSIMVDPQGTGVGFAEAEVDFDQTKIQLTGEIGSGTALANKIMATSRADANNTGHAVVVFGLATQDTNNPPTGSFLLATMPFTTITGQSNITTNVTVNLLGSQIVDNGSNPGAMSLVGQNSTLTLNAAAATPTPTPTPSPTPIPPTPTPTQPAGGGVASLTLAWGGSGIVGVELSVDINFVSTTDVSGVDAVVKFDTTKLNGLRVDAGTIFPAMSKVDINNSTGVIKFSQVDNPGSGKKGGGKLATLVFMPNASGSSTLSWDFTPGSLSDSNAIELATGHDILVRPADLSVSASNHATLNIALLTPGSNAVTGTVSDGNGWSSGISTDNTGSMTGLAAPDAWIGHPENLWVKVSGFLKKKTNLTINQGANLANFGNLVPGDLNNDGVINTADLSLMYDHWFGTGAADFNNDGIVNSADHWYLVNNFFRTDD